MRGIWREEERLLGGVLLLLVYLGRQGVNRIGGYRIKNDWAMSTALQFHGPSAHTS